MGRVIVRPSGIWPRSREGSSRVYHEANVRGFQHYSASVSQDCITAYNDLKLSKKYKYIIYKLTDDYKEIVVEEASADKDWDNFREKLINATSKSRSVRHPVMSRTIPHTCFPPGAVRGEAETYVLELSRVEEVLLTRVFSGCCWQGPPLRCLRLRVQPRLW